MQDSVGGSAAARERASVQGSNVSAKGSGEWTRTMQLYNVRNQIAHGTLLSEGIDVSSEIQDFFRIHESLIRN